MLEVQLVGVLHDSILHMSGAYAGQDLPAVLMFLTVLL